MRTPPGRISVPELDLPLMPPQSFRFDLGFDSAQGYRAGAFYDGVIIELQGLEAAMPSARCPKDDAAGRAISSPACP